MSDDDRRPTNVNVTPGTTESRGSGLYFIVGALVVAVLVGGFLLFGGNLSNRGDVARGPDSKVDVTIQQPRAPATPPAATPAPATPAAPAAPRQ